MKLRRIATPERVEYFKTPDGWNEGKYTPGIAPASGKRYEAKILPDGRLAVAYSDRYTMGGQPFYLVFASEQAYRDYARREPQVDPEERGGRWYSGEYTRLKVREKQIPDEKMYRGYRREYVCTCHHCGKETPYSDAKYLAGGDHCPQYFPFCSDACVDEALAKE